MSELELTKINGGSISATYINALARGIQVVYELGRSLGSSIKNLISGRKC